MNNNVANKVESLALVVFGIAMHKSAANAAVL